MKFNLTTDVELDYNNITDVRNQWVNKLIIDKVRDFQFIVAAKCPGTEASVKKYL